MTDQGEQPNSDGTSKRLEDQMALLTFLRVEASANREALREDADANRKLLSGTLKLVSPILAAVIFVAGYLGIHDLATFKESIKVEGEAEAKLEIQKMDRHIDETLTAEFQKDEIRKTIQNAAVIATQREAKPLIEAGVKSQVGAAVAQQSGFIQRVAIEAVNSTVQTTVAPLVAKVGESAARENVIALIQQVNADSARAFDKLTQIRDVPQDQVRQIRDVEADKRNHILDSFHEWNDPEECTEPLSGRHKDDLLAADANVRVKAIQACSGWIEIEPHDPQNLPPSLGRPQVRSSLPIFQAEEEVIPQLVNSALNDGSLLARASATHVLNEFLGGSPGFPAAGLDLLETGQLKEWWQGNQQGYETLLLLSRASAKPANMDSAELYDDLRALHRMPDPHLEMMLQEDVARFRDFASMRASPEDLKRSLGRKTCDEVEGDFRGRLKSWEGSPAPNQQDDYGFEEMEFLTNCQAVPTLIPHVVGYETSSESLRRRFEVGTLLNAWAKLQFDPLDAASYRGWWNKHKLDYEK